MEVEIARVVKAPNPFVLIHRRAIFRLIGGDVAWVSMAALVSRTDWAGHFAVIEDGRTSMTPLPSAG